MAISLHIKLLLVYQPRFCIIGTKNALDGLFVTILAARFLEFL